MTQALVGILVTDRDADLIPPVLQRLGASIARLEARAPVDLVVSMRQRDRRARAQIASHLPRAFRRLDFHFAEYDAEWKGTHTTASFDAVCRQRNDLLARARDGGYAWLLFLDSDVVVAEDTLERLVAAPGDVVHAPYRPRWAAHPIVGVAAAADSSEVELLVNPHLFETPDAAFAATMVAGGCTMIRRSAYEAAFEVADFLTVRGEDLGFCVNARAMGRSITCLSRHLVEHRCRAADHLLLPRVDDHRAFRLTQADILAFSAAERRGAHAGAGALDRAYAGRVQ